MGIAAAARLVAAHGAAPSPLLLLAGGAAARQDVARTSQPRAQLQRLGEIVLLYARLIGRLRHRISDLHHAPDPAALSRAVEAAVSTLHHLCDLEAEISPPADAAAAADDDDDDDDDPPATAVALPAKTDLADETKAPNLRFNPRANMPPISSQARPRAIARCFHSSPAAFRSSLSVGHFQLANPAVQQISIAPASSASSPPFVFIILATSAAKASKASNNLVESSLASR